MITKHLDQKVALENSWIKWGFFNGTTPYFQLEFNRPPYNDTTATQTLHRLSYPAANRAGITMPNVNVTAEELREIADFFTEAANLVEDNS